MKKYCFYLIAMALIVLSACAPKTVIQVPQLPPRSVPEIGGPVPTRSTVPAHSTVPTHRTEPTRNTEPNGAAVAGKKQAQNPLLSSVRPVQRPRPQALTRMIEQAEKQLKNKQPQLAFSTLEQALFIDGQDPLVWHLMARSQFDQGNLVQAVSLAKKSDSLAAAYPQIKEKNAALLAQIQGSAN